MRKRSRYNQSVGPWGRRPKPVLLALAEGLVCAMIGVLVAISFLWALV
jgi:hypothetical protein